MNTLPVSWLRGLSRRGILEVIPGVYQVTVRGANIIAVVEETITLIDTGFRGSSRQLLPFLRSLGRSPDEISLVVITHSHYDHVGGLAELKRLTGARAAAHVADIRGPTLPYPAAVRRILRLRPFASLRSALAIDAAAIDTPLSGGEVLAPLGGLQVIHTPGHTPGSICLFSPERRLLIVGDALDKSGPNILPPHKSTNTDNEKALESAKKLAGLDFDILCFGHGRPFKEGVREKMQRLLEKAR